MNNQLIKDLKTWKRILLFLAVVFFLILLRTYWIPELEISVETIHRRPTWWLMSFSCFINYITVSVIHHAVKSRMQ